MNQHKILTLGFFAFALVVGYASGVMGAYSSIEQQAAVAALRVVPANVRKAAPVQDLTMGPRKCVLAGLERVLDECAKPADKNVKPVPPVKEAVRKTTPTAVSDTSSDVKVETTVSTEDSTVTN